MWTVAYKLWDGGGSRSSNTQPQNLTHTHTHTHTHSLSATRWFTTGEKLLIPSLICICEGDLPKDKVYIGVKCIIRDWARKSGRYWLPATIRIDGSQGMQCHSLLKKNHCQCCSVCVKSKPWLLCFAKPALRTRGVAVVKNASWFHANRGIGCRN